MARRVISIFLEYILFISYYQKFKIRINIRKNNIIFFLSAFELNIYLVC
jgi:hypothetical protein